MLFHFLIINKLLSVWKDAPRLSVKKEYEIDKPKMTEEQLQEERRLVIKKLQEPMKFNKEMVEFTNNLIISFVFLVFVFLFVFCLMYLA